LGSVALVLGCFDLLASVSVSLFTDRFGKLRSVILGTGGVLLGYGLLPFLNSGLVGAVIGIILTRTSFEFGIVSQISLISEQAPDRRGKIMSLAAAFVLMGGTVANLIGPWLYTRYGVAGLSWTGVATMVVALILLVTQVSEVEPSHELHGENG
jgi:predicted MFS family arabinose efflux permease